jgi:hypothetical protein
LEVDLLEPLFVWIKFGDAHFYAGSVLRSRRNNSSDLIPGESANSEGDTQQKAEEAHRDEKAGGSHWNLRMLKLLELVFGMRIALH